MKNVRIILPLLGAALLGNMWRDASAQTQPVRQRLSLDRGWQFHLGNAALPDEDFQYGIGASFAKAGDGPAAAKPDFDAREWRTVDVPHDWVVEQDFVNINNDDVKAHGYKPVGRQFPATTIGWYRRTFVIPKSDAGRRLAIQFDGVFRDCTVWLNGHFIGRNLSGYSEFLFDITDYVLYGEKNLLAIRADASQYEGWFYEGGGIYRHTWLLKYGAVNIPHFGVFVSTEMRGNDAAVHVHTDIVNESTADVSCTLLATIRDPDGHAVASSESQPLALGTALRDTVRQTMTVNNPRLWSVESPNMYTVELLLRAGDRLLDRVETPFGIRTIRFDKDQGLFLNGKPVKIKGVCCHQDHAGVGSALPDRLQYYRIERLKEMGCNAYRTSHNPPTPELLEACDRLGMLVLDENRLLGSSPEVMSQFDRLVLRDRNHPSVILWSIGNEEWKVQNTDIGRRIALSLIGRLKQLDPTRLCTYAADNGDQFEGINSVIPVRGFNYHIKDVDKYRKNHPGQPLLGSEMGSTVCTRGIYENDKEKGYVCDYDSTKPSWASTAQEWWTIYAARPWLAGGFVWTGFDYRGEPTPYGWPCINSHFGIMDVCGFPKNNFYYYQAWWSDKDVLHIFPHWNWKAGETVQVWCHSNCDSVELFLNGKSLGRKSMPPNEHLTWSVRFEPGTLEAHGWRHGKMLTARRETTGQPARLKLAADRLSIDADGNDLAIVTVSAVDAQGREVPVADSRVRFRISGNGTIIGVGNGDPSSHEPDKYLTGQYSRSLFNGCCQVIVQSGRRSGRIELQAEAEGLEGTSISISTAAPAQMREEAE